MVQGPITDRLIATSNMWAYFLAHVIWAVVFVTGSCLMVPGHGSTGLSLARLLAYAIGGISVVVLALHYTKSNREFNA
jgi:hypothetical protein